MLGCDFDLELGLLKDKSNSSQLPVSLKAISSLMRKKINNKFVGILELMIGFSTLLSAHSQISREAAQRRIVNILLLFRHSV